MVRARKIINIIELDSRDSRFQSGIARYFDILAENMPENVVTFKIIFCHSPDTTDVNITMSDDELTVSYPTGFPQQALFEAALAFVGNKFNDMENMIVKSNCLGMENFAYMLRSRFYCKTVGVLHCLPHLSFNNPGGLLPKSNPLGHMDSIILVCYAGVQWLSGVKNKRPYSIIYNGINKPKISSQKKSDGVFRFIWANGWGNHKGLGRIIPAIRQVAANHKIEIIVLGGGLPPETADISDLPIINVGLVNDPKEIAGYYEQADCALFASYSEACSFAGIEAMAYNLPIISSDAAGLVEMFGNAALYTKTNAQRQINTDEYAAHMINIIENKRLRTKLAVAAYARYLQKYTAKKMAGSTLKLYYDLLK